jgi:hypothetical protein
MRSKVSVTQLASYVCALSILSYAFSFLSLRPPSEAGDITEFTLVCVISSLAFPFVLILVRLRISYRKGLLALIISLTIAQAVGFAVYAWKTSAIQHGDHESLNVFTLYWMASLMIAVIFYTFGFWASRWTLPNE